uniref:uncharacterized protein n=1 Tax=Semicossyphus pulcher TaxID=241346 RepID=UPI0037E8035C
MAEFKWIQMFLYLIQVLLVTAKTTHNRSLIIRDGEDVSLPCDNVINDNCDGTAWSFSQLTKTGAVDLVRGGRVHERTKYKRDRLGVTANCSLVIKNVTKEDVGRYFCIQHIRGQTQNGEAVVDVSVVTMTEQKDDNKVTLKCRLSTRHSCEHTVDWLFLGKDVDKDHRDLNPSQLNCAAIVTFETSHFIVDSNKLLTCNVKENKGGRSVQFTFSRLSPGRKKGRTALENNDTTTKPEGLWWVYVIAAVGLAALFITAVAIRRRRRNKGNKTPMDKNVADPEEGVSYVSIRHTKKGNSKAQVRGDDAVTYSTVKASSADPSNLYATIN